MLYNINTNDVLILQINLKVLFTHLPFFPLISLLSCFLRFFAYVSCQQSTFIPFTTTTIAPGGHSHVIECGGQLLGYSALTGDLVTYHIETSSKRVVPAGISPPLILFLLLFALLSSPSPSSSPFSLLPSFVCCSMGVPSSLWLLYFSCLSPSLSSVTSAPLSSRKDLLSDLF